jgi:hypothetical protein
MRWIKYTIFKQLYPEGLENGPKEGEKQYFVSGTVCRFTTSVMAF